MAYTGEVQAAQFACVFASVSAAVNSVCDEQIWTQHTLFDEWSRQGINQVHFRNIARVAIERVCDRAQAYHHCDGPTAISNEDYLKKIKDCIDAGGIAIVSFQIADSHLNRQPAWHMLSLVRRDGDNFTAWDTAAGNEMTITAAQLVTHIPYGPGALAVHNEHDVLLVKPT
jgi:hypothetical protein